MNEYHYTLYYYDIAGNLIKTVPPEGVKFITSSADLTQIVNHRYDDVTYDDTVYTAHKMETRYWYNTLNLPIKQYTPDGDTTRFWYDVVGRLVVSQSARQRPDTFSYTIYDPLGRITEVGRLSQTTDMEQTISQSPSSLGSWISGGSNRKEVTKTFYDASVFTVPGLEQENLRSRVASTTLMDTYSATITNYDVATHYSYDIAGNVKTIVNDIKSLNSYKERYKRIDYEYDLVSGNVNNVYYQRDSADQFIYEYTYDADNRILEAKTSRDGYIWDRDANYLYYNHGPLARTEIGEQQVQALDYAYSIQGWLKGINGLHLLKSHDMGQDGNSGAMQHKRFPVDVFGMNIGYFEGDYSQITKQIKWEPQYASSAFSSASKNLYNGNIRNIALSADKINPKTIGYSYGYDQLNRLVSMDPYSSFSGTNYEWPTTSNPLKDYRERVTYDANGNILTYNRHGEGTTWKMDSLEYNYYTDKNRLHYVDDKVSAGNYPEDIDDQSSGNYTYDASGNLITDTKEGITKIEWTTYGKVKKIIKSGTTLTFSYDPAGNRIYKKVATTGQPNVFTYYIRDAQGNIMSTYVLKSDTVRWSEQMMYGSSRLGIVNLNEITAPLTFNPTDTTTTGYLEGLKNYELTNHLGNVQAVVSDKKIGIDNNNDDINNYWIAEQLVAQDYYPFGMVMPERSFSGGNYRYGFNGQEKVDEVSGPGNHNTAMFWEYDTRLGRRWNIDPLFKMFPSSSPYSTNLSNPILLNDPDGDCPICFLLFGLITLPSIGVAPTGQPSDQIAIQDAQRLQEQWLAYTLLANGLANGTISGSKLAKEMGNQFTVQAIGNAATQAYLNGKVDFSQVINESFKNLDIADGLISQLNISDLKKNIMAATVDLTTEEAALLGDKSLKEASVDFIANTIGTNLNGKIPRGKYAALVEKVIGASQNEATEYFNEALKTDFFDEASFDLGVYYAKPDKTVHKIEKREVSPKKETVIRADED